MNPHKWYDALGGEWRIKTDGSFTSLMREIKLHLHNMIWEDASRHRCGMGLQSGADLTVLKKHIKWYQKKGMQKEAGLLATIAAGGMWPLARFKDHGMIEDATCPHCGRCDQESHGGSQGQTQASDERPDYSVGA